MEIDPAELQKALKSLCMETAWREFGLMVIKLFSLFPSYALAYWWGWLTNGIKVVLKGK